MAISGEHKISLPYLTYNHSNYYKKNQDSPYRMETGSVFFRYTQTILQVK